MQPLQSVCINICMEFSIRTDCRILLCVTHAACRRCYNNGGSWVVAAGFQLSLSLRGRRPWQSVAPASTADMEPAAKRERIAASDFLGNPPRNDMHVGWLLQGFDYLCHCEAEGRGNPYPCWQSRRAAHPVRAANSRPYEPFHPCFPHFNRREATHLFPIA